MAKISKKTQLTEMNCSAEQQKMIMNSFGKIRTLFTTDLLGWLAGLFDPNTGGFYYSNSARDNDGFLPDIESTNQVLSILTRSGAIASYDDLPVLLKREITFFVCQKEDRETGFFFHPQWKYERSNTNICRLSRDLQAADTIFRGMNFGTFSKEMLITNATDKINKNEMFVHLSSEASLISYLDEMPLNHETASFIASQINIFNSLGFSDTVCDWLISKQDPDTGLFGDAEDRKAVSAFHGICWFFIACKRYLPNCEKAVFHILKHLSGPSAGTVYYVSACWRSLANIVEICNFDKDKQEKVLKEICENAELPLVNTYNVLLNSKWDDGSFSYHPSGSNSTSQGMPVAVPDAREGDVNATLLAIGILTSIYQAMGIDAIRTPIFTSSDFAYFLEKIKIV